jgi:hypothetical protein
VLGKVVGVLHEAFDGNVVGSIAVTKVVTMHKKGHPIPNFTFFIFLLKQKTHSFWWIINLQQAFEKERKNLFGLFRNMQNKSMRK